MMMVSRSLIAEEHPITAGHVLVRCLDNRWRFFDTHPDRQRQERCRVVWSDKRYIGYVSEWKNR